MKLKQLIYGDTVLTSSAKDYPSEWAKICELCSLFPYERKTRYQFIFKVGLTEINKHL